MADLLFVQMLTRWLPYWIINYGGDGPYSTRFYKEGRLCWLRSPLHIVTNGKNEEYYFTDAEFEEAKRKGKIKGEAHRNKGLGSLEPEQAKKSMFSPEYQRMDVMEYTEDAMSLLYDLMGEDVDPRRDFIMNNVDFSEIAE